MDGRADRQGRLGGFRRFGGGTVVLPTHPNPQSSSQGLPTAFEESEKRRERDRERENSSLRSAAVLGKTSLAFDLDETAIVAPVCPLQRDGEEGVSVALSDVPMCSPRRAVLSVADTRAIVFRSTVLRPVAFNLEVARQIERFRKVVSLRIDTEPENSRLRRRHWRL